MPNSAHDKCLCVNLLSQKISRVSYVSRKSYEDLSHASQISQRGCDLCQLATQCFCSSKTVLKTSEDTDLYNRLFIFVNKCKYSCICSVQRLDALRFFVLLSSPLGMESWWSHSSKGDPLGTKRLRDYLFKSWLRDSTSKFHHHGHPHTFRFKSNYNRDVDMTYRPWAKVERKEWLPKEGPFIILRDISPGKLLVLKSDSEKASNH